MPYNAKQIRLFQAAKHNPAFAKKVGMSRKTASKLLRHAKTPVKSHAMRG